MHQFVISRGAVGWEEKEKLKLDSLRSVQGMKTKLNWSEATRIFVIKAPLNNK
jgi:hypothetical protein